MRLISCIAFALFLGVSAALTAYAAEARARILAYCYAT